MLQLKIIKGPAGEGQSFPLYPGKSLTVGRAETCEVRLPSAGISKTHCRLTGVSGSRAEIEDLGSANGTFVNGLLVKKHALKPGDTVSLSDFIFSVGIEAPRPAVGNANFEVPGGPGEGTVAPGKRSLGEKMFAWVEANVFPWADNLSQKFDVRTLIGGFFVLWSVLIIMVTVSPFAERANTRVQSESVQVARLYARQLVRLNQQSIIDQRYRDLIVELDSRKGQTPGIIEAAILDVGKSQILAPVELIGHNVPNTFAGIALTKDEEFTQFDSDGTAYVSAPIKVGTSDGLNKTVATAFVTYNTLSGQFTFANMLDQAVTSLLIALFVSVLLFLLLYRWIEGSIATVSARIDEAMKNSDTSVTSPVKWPALAQLCEMASSALSRSMGGAAMQTQESDWAVTCVNACIAPAAAFNASLTVIAWNAAMERIIGIRANLALGSDISGASRDIAFESAIRDLAAGAVPPWSNAERKIDFAGRPFRVSMASGSGAHFVMILPGEE